MPTGPAKDRIVWPLKRVMHQTLSAHTYPERLLCGLKKGNQYRLEFFIKSPHAILDSIGVYFGPIDPLLERKPIHLLSPFFLKNDNSNKFLKDSSWQKVMLVYTAKGDEAFISVADFSRNDITGPTGIPMENHFFVFLDEFSLVPLNPDEQLCNNWRQVKEDIYDQNERHEFLQQSLKYHSSQPHPVQLALTYVTVTDTLLYLMFYFPPAWQHCSMTATGCWTVS